MHSPNNPPPPHIQCTQSSACATFNILNQEDRRVVGALLAVDEDEPPPAPTPTAGGAA